jgi:hypothetical protein
MHAYIRLKTALTEHTPVIKPYDEAGWADLPDSRLPIAVSLAILEGVHARLTAVLRAIAPADWGRTFTHPEFPDGPRTLDWHVQTYAWHGRHHLAHITGLRAREGW